MASFTSRDSGTQDYIQKGNDDDCSDNRKTSDALSVSRVHMLC
jgi:hypothetical protein